MKKLLIAMIALSLGLAATAQGKKHEGKERKFEKKEHMRQQFKTNHLDKKLNLTDAQGQRIKEVNMDFRTKMKEVQKDETLTSEQKKEQIRTLQQSHTEQIKSILTEEQKNKLEALKKNRAEHKTDK
jgi:Spy/CpxP family protein refolding chaperone